MNEPDFTGSAASSWSSVPWIKQENEDESEDDGESNASTCSDEEQLLPSTIKQEKVLVKEEAEEDPIPPEVDSPEFCAVLDPRCRSGIPELAALWPVYVGNFYCPQATSRDEAIRKCFAAKGLTVRWWFRPMDEYYYAFQLQAGLYDMLVYFGSEAEALQAIRKCNRQYYFGNVLNVLSGREPAYFPQWRSLYAQQAQLGLQFSEDFFEHRLRRWGFVNCVAKFDMCSGAVEMDSAESAARAQALEQLFSLQPVETDIRKQRYLEEDVLELIESFLAVNLDVLRPDNPLVVTAVAAPVIKKKKKRKAHRVRPVRRGPSKYRQRIKLQRKVEKYRKKIDKALDEGKQPHCFDNHRKGKKRFRKLVEEALNKRGIKTEIKQENKS